MEQRYKKKSSGISSIAVIVFAFLFLAIMISGGVLFAWNYLLSPISSENKERVFVVEKNESVSSISKRLKDEGLIKSDLVFKAFAKFSGKGASLQPGSYNLSSSMTLEEILTNLQQARNTDVKLTLIEGWRIEEMAEKIEKDLGINKQDFLLVAKEGYMFPDTYFFKKDTTALDVANKMRSTFDSKYDASLKSKIAAQGLTVEQGVIFASMVEREARTDEVRTNVASIILKRYRIGMKLDIDATVQYALGYQVTEKSWWKKNLLFKDLAVNSPYNTYINNGFPPAPICNPSLSSLRAVTNADPSTPYLFYFHDSKGNTYYGKTLEEHNQNIARYR
jgi:UPF0755 protein